MAGIVLQRNCSLGVPDGILSTPDVRALAGGVVEPGQVSEVGGDCGGEEFFGPPDRLVLLQTDRDDGGVGGDRCCGGQVGLIGRPTEPGAQVLELDLHPPSRRVVTGTVPHLVVGGGLGRAVAGVTIAEFTETAGGGVLVFGELADCFQQPVPGPATDPGGGDQRFADQRIDKVEHLLLVEPVTHRRHRHHIEPAREHRTRCQHRLLISGKQVIGPLQRLSQGLMPFQPAP